MNFRIVLLLFISHLLGDFVFQSKYILKLRFEKALRKNVKGNTLHVLVHFVLLLIILSTCKVISISNSSISFKYILSISLIISITHFFIDELKTLLINFKVGPQKNIWIFLMDQIFHFILIIFIVYGDKLTFSVNELRNCPKNINYIDKSLISIAVFLLCTFASGIFIKQYIEYMNFKNHNKMLNKNYIILGSVKELHNGGFIIGILERSFILLVMAIGEPAMIGFVLTAKSIARFKKLDDPSFAEYFLIGTFMSFIVAILGGILIYALKIFPIIK